MAKRVAYLCANPGCRQSTAGPQSEPSGTVNIGVAAHITGASPNGPRYDSSLSSAERSSAANGIWLCQTCGKLVDNDLSGYPVEKLREWKANAEAAAARALAHRRSPATESEGVFLEAERLMTKLIAELRADVRTEGAELVREFVILGSRSVARAFTLEKRRFFYFEEEHDDLLLQIDWLEEVGAIVDVTPSHTPMYRIVPEFASWLRSGDTAKEGGGPS